MSEFTATDLLTAAKKRYRESVLRQRMIGAAGDGALADAELLEIAEGVIGRIRSAAQASVGWPVLVTSNVLQHALELFNFRTLSPLEVIAKDQRDIGAAAEAFFNGLEEGDDAWGIDSSRDVGTSAPVAARDRDGNALIGTITDRSNSFGTLSGPGWDWT